MNAAKPGVGHERGGPREFVLLVDEGAPLHVSQLTLGGGDLRPSSRQQHRPRLAGESTRALLERSVVLEERSHRDEGAPLLPFHRTGKVDRRTGKAPRAGGKRVAERLERARGVHHVERCPRVRGDRRPNATHAVRSAQLLHDAPGGPHRTQLLPRGPPGANHRTAQDGLDHHARVEGEGRHRGDERDAEQLGDPVAPRGERVRDDEIGGPLAHWCQVIAQHRRRHLHHRQRQAGQPVDVRELVHRRGAIRHRVGPRVGDHLHHRSPSHVAHEVATPHEFGDERTRGPHVPVQRHAQEEDAHQARCGAPTRSGDAPRSTDAPLVRNDGRPGSLAASSIIRR